MSEQQFILISDLVNQGKFAEALAVANTINDPRATEWQQHILTRMQLEDSNKKSNFWIF